MPTNDERWDVTVKFTDGHTEQHNDVSTDRSRELENLAFTKPEVIFVNAQKR